MLGQCWADVGDGGPTLAQHWVNWILGLQQQWVNFVFAGAKKQVPYINFATYRIAIVQPWQTQSLVAKRSINLRVRRAACEMHLDPDIRWE